MKRREFLATASGATGGVAAASAGAAGTASAQEQHTVNMTDGLNFEPASITVAPGDTVVWENTGSIGHSVTAYEDDIPEEAEYWASGGFDSEDAARGAYTAGDPDSGDVPGGESYEHTFEVTGTYEYFCIPHESAGMLGTVEVQEGANEEEAGGGGPTSPEEFGVPFQPHYVGVATILGMALTLIFTFYVLKYGESPHASSPNRK